MTPSAKTSADDFDALFLPSYQAALTRVASGRAPDDEIRAVIGWAIDGFVARGKKNLLKARPNGDASPVPSPEFIEALKRVQERVT